MEYQKLINLSDNTNNHPSKFRTKNWVELNDVRGAYNTNSQFKFKNTMLISSLFDYSNAYILVKGIIRVVGQGADAAAIAIDGNNKQAIFKNCASFTDCISEINNTQVDHSKIFRCCDVHV